MALPLDSFPYLSVILLAPLVAAFTLVFVPQEETWIIKTLSAIAMLCSLALSLVVYIQYDFHLGGLQFKESIPWITDLGANYSLGVDGISLPLLLLTSLIGFSAVYASWRVNQRVKEFFILLLVLVAGVMGTFITTDLFIFFLFYEVVVIPIYIMILVWGSSKRVTKEYAGMKLTIYLLLGSAFLLVGLIAVYVKAYSITGVRSLDLAFLSQVLYPEKFQIFAFLLIGLGFGTLISMWPFHSWSPDGYAGAPSAVSMIHAGVLKKIGGYGLIRIGLFLLPAGAKFWAPVIALLAVGNVVYAALICLAQNDLKYVIGYSSVSHMGYVLIGFAALNVVSVNGAVAQMFAHGVMAALFFALVGNLYEKSHTRSIPELGGLAHQMPLLATGLMLAGLASLGLPGLASFPAEFTIFVGAFPAYRWFTVLAISGVVFTAVYILRMLGSVLYGPRQERWDKLPDLRGAEMIPLLVLGSVLIVVGFFPSLLMDVVNSGVVDLIARVDLPLTVGGGF
ncbi:MAG: NADH-quinone oxidoreductase subunit M [Syntrophomonadaceae bacterium]|nr:NADH-quinone oxidoreductase subunit M [Syntrophomonadaceae bacterium]